MTHRQESMVASARVVTAGRAVAARWCALAEQRLHHLSEMFETGRWRRYHSEIEFLENIREAKRAVEAWQALASGADATEMAASWVSSYGRSSAAVPEPPAGQQPQIVQPKAVHIAPDRAAPVSLRSIHDILAEVIEGSSVPPATPAPTEKLSFTAPAEVPPLRGSAARAPLAEPAADFTFHLDGLEAKYPLLRNAL